MLLAVGYLTSAVKNSPIIRSKRISVVEQRSGSFYFHLCPMEHFFKKNFERAKRLFFVLFHWLQYTLLSRSPIVGPKEGMLILFIGDHIQPRITRLAKFLGRESNIHCWLLTMPSKADETFDTSVFDQVMYYRSGWELRSFLKRVQNVNVLHAFPPSNKSARIALDMGIAPLVFDVQDLHVSNFGLKPHQLYMKMDLPHEAYCLENADLVISQSAEVQPARITYGLKKKAPSLFFPLYCDDDNMVHVERKLDPNDVHIVYAGSAFSSQRDPKHYSNMQFHGLIKKLATSGVYFHLYPSPHIDNIAIREYKTLAQEHEHFFYHDPVKQDILAKELSQYHFGLLPFFDSGTERAKVKRRRGTSLKLFNYLEAGLPVLIARDMEFQLWMAKRYGAAISIKEEDLNDLKSVVHAIDYNAMLSKLYRDRKKLLLSKQIPRLLKAYSQQID